VWTLHSVHGSYFHSLAAFFPFGVAVAAAGAERVLASRDVAAARLWAFGGLIVIVALTYGSVVQWDATFGGLARERRAALEAIPPGPFLAIDAAAWSFISGRSVIVTPADGLFQAGCAIAKYGANSIVLERAHFTRYDGLYRGDLPPWLGPPIARGDIRVFPVHGDIGCSIL
jgi:hypothetical protein